MMTKTPAKNLDQYIVRFPDGMRDALKKLAKDNNRSLNAEIIARLERSFTDGWDAPAEAELAEKMMALERSMAETEERADKMLTESMRLSAEAKAVAEKVLDALKKGDTPE